MTGYGATDRRSSSDSSNSQESSTSSTAASSPRPSAISFKLGAVFYLFGVIVLLPCNAVTLSLPYLLERMNGSVFETNFESWLNLTYTLAGFIALVVAVSVDEKVRPNLSVTISAFAMSVGFLLLGTLPFWPASASTVATITLTISTFLAASTAFFRTPIIVIATAFGPEAISAYFSGTALVAMVISGGTFIATYISGTQGNNGGKIGAVTCFMVSAIVAILLSLLAYQFVRRTEIYRRKFASTKDVRSESPEQERLLRQLRISLVLGESMWTVSRRHLLRNLAQFYLFVVTLAVYPAITSLIVPVSRSWDPITFKTFHFFIFNLGDFVGRLMASMPLPGMLKMASSQFILALLRTLFIPLFLLCNTQLAPTPLSPWVGDIGFLAVLFLFAVTNGYTSSLGYVSLGSGASARSGARVLQLWMYAGLVVGNVASFGVSALMQRWKEL